MLFTGCATTAGIYILRTPVVAETDPGDDGTIRFVTANLAVSPGINWGSSTRLKHIGDIVRTLYEENDVVCLQEVWPYEDKIRLMEELGIEDDRYYITDTRGMGETGTNYCDGGLSSIKACVRKRCADVPVEDQTTCAREQCTIQLGMLLLFKRACADCLVSMVGHSIDDIALACGRPPGHTKVYDGSNGVILLSKHGLRNRSYELLPASSANRVVLFAEVRGSEMPPIEVGCPHLSSEEIFPPTYGGFSSWDEERIAQLRGISRAFDRRRGPRTQVLIGDMNFGPDQPGDVTGFSLPAWEESDRLGYLSPIANTIPRPCSFCSGNRLRFDSDGPSFLVDHVLYHRENNVAGLVPTFARTLPLPLVEICVRERGGRCVRTKQVHLSDHRPVQVGFTVTSSRSDHVAR